MIKVGYRIVGNNTVPLTLSISILPHWLICGPSGSGKSYLLKFLFWSLFKNAIEIHVCDYKCSGDYDGFMDTEHFAVGKDCIEMIERFYYRYKEIKEKNLPDKIMLVFDEWAAFCLWAEGVDKRGAKDMKDKISEILMMGRRLGSNGGGAYIWTVLQRPDAAFFGSSRENYFVKIVMKEITKSIRMMLDLEESDIPVEHIAVTGHGICVLENAIYPFVVPSYDPEAMNALLKAERERSRKQG